MRPLRVRGAPISVSSAQTRGEGEPDGIRTLGTGSAVPTHDPVQGTRRRPADPFDTAFIFADNIP